MNISRDLSVHLEQRLATFQPVIQILTGPRQVGKTTAAKALRDKFPDKTTYLSFEQSESPPKNNEEQLRFAWQRSRDRSTHNILILDEVQNVMNWASIIKELYDTDRPRGLMSVCLLGSSALELSLSGAESLLGRFELIRATHWTAAEHAQAFGWTTLQYLQMGGYPVIGELMQDWSKQSLERCRAYVRDAIIDPVITRDILALKPTLNSALLKQTLEIVLSIPCREISFAKLLGQLSDSGNASTVKGYLQLLERAFLIKLLYRYSGTQLRVRTSSPKLVPLAPALIHAATNPLKVQDDPGWFGDVFEAALIAQLNTLGFEMHYWSDSRYDVDVVLKRDQEVLALEIKSNNSQDWIGLKKFKSAFPKARIALVNRELGEELLMAPQPKLLATLEGIWRAAL
jgi:predicted AAA+ superfamily ATPase